jgi:putative adhesin
MGKRELLLIAAFLIAGAIVYQVTAPPPAPGERSFSPSGLLEHFRRGVRGNRASAEVKTRSTHPVEAGVTELRLALRSGDVTITGEARGDIDAEFRVWSNGYDDAEAQRLAKESALIIDRAGSRLVLQATYPDAGSQRGTIVLKVPSSLSISFDGGSGELSIARVATVDLGNARGRGELREISGRVSGTFRGGELRVINAGSLKLTTNGAEVRVEQIRGETTLNTRGGELKGSDLAGPIDIDSAGTDIVLEKLDKTSGILRINAVSGSVTVKGLRTEGRIDVRGADVAVEVERAAPLAIYSEGGDPIEITPPPGGYQLDAVANDGTITVPAGTLEVATSGQERRATGPVNGGGPTITIRSARGNITVR